MNLSHLPGRKAFCLFFALAVLLAACSPSPEQVEPRILAQDEFAYWSWEPDSPPAAPVWYSVLPPEDLTENFTLAGYSGDMDAVTADEDWDEGCHSDALCTRIVYAPAQGTRGWAGNLWVDVLYPLYSQGVNLEAVGRLTFWAKGDKGGERVEFRVGAAEGVTPQPAFSSGVLTLQPFWQQYSIEITEHTQLDHVFSGFMWITSDKLNPEGCIFYLDDMQFE